MLSAIIFVSSLGNTTCLRSFPSIHTFGQDQGISGTSLLKLSSHHSTLHLPLSYPTSRYIVIMSASTTDTTSAPQEHPVYKGSCHCGFITYSVRLNLTTPNPRTGAIITRCNCTICLKGGSTLIIPEEGSFKLLTPTEGMDALTDYTYNTNRIHHRFCPKCGVRCFLNGIVEVKGQKMEIWRINVSTLDEREDGEPLPELKDIKLKYFSLRDDQGSRGVADEPYERGLW